MTSSAVQGALVLASEAGKEADGLGAIPAWAFGIGAFGLLVGLLIITVMIKVER